MKPPESSGESMEARIVVLDNGMAFVLCPHCGGIHKHLIVSDASGILRSGCLVGEYRLGPFYNFREAEIAVNRRAAELERKRKKKPVPESSGE